MRTLGVMVVVGLLVLAAGAGAARSQQQPPTVTIRGFAFQPATLRVTLSGGRQEVRWTNSDGVAHTVTSDNNAFDSGALGDGVTFAFTFTSAGTFAYHCEIHGRMRGQIVVEQASASGGEKDSGDGY